MKLFRRSLTEDSVDRYNNTWTVCVLLLLDITTWLLPLVFFKDQDPTLASPTYTAKCWYPAQFSSSMQEYANSACTSAFQRSIQGDYGDSNKATEPATIYLEEGNISDAGYKVFRPDRSDHIKEMKYNIRNQKFLRISEKYPDVLFILALLLKLPYMLWDFLLSCIGIRLGQVLEAVKSSDLPVDGRRRDTNSDVLTAVSEFARSSSKKASMLYLVIKLLACLAAIIGSFVTMLQISIYLTNSSNFETLEGHTDYSRTPLFCLFTIKQFQQIHKWKIQCIFSSERPGGILSPPETTNENLIYELYMNLYSVLILLFLVLTVANVVSFVKWLARLVPGPYRRRVLSSISLPMDVCLMLYMAEDNCGILIARALKDYLVKEKESIVAEEQEIEKTV